MPLGDDFRWSDMSEARAQYDNYERLFDYMNAQKEWNVQVQWGTLSSYFGAIRERMNIPATSVHVPAPYPVLSGDFFTYADRVQDYWSG